MSRAEAAVLRGRRKAESLMRDTALVTRIDPEGPVDPLTGLPTRTPVYEGKAKVQTYEAYEQNPEAGAHSWTVQRYTLHVTVGAFEPQIGDLIEITAARLDPLLTGRKFRVVALLHKSMATAYRLGIEEVPR